MRIDETGVALWPGRRPPYASIELWEQSVFDAVTNVPAPANEPVKSFASGSPERAALETKIKELAGEPVDLSMTIGGVQRMGGGGWMDVVQPHNHAHVLGRLGEATDEDVVAAIEAARLGAPGWRELSFDDRAAIFLRAAELLAGPWRSVINASTMLGQSKSVYQAEIDAACELIDFWRYNAAYARRLLAEQPVSSPGLWNRLEYRPLEGFVLAITPFNFTSIAGNLPTAPALLDNVVLWAASRAYIPRRRWKRMQDSFVATVESLTVGDVTADLSTFMGAVIDERAYAKHVDALSRARSRSSVRVVTGGSTDRAHGYFVKPTVLECSDPTDEVFTTEYFGPILAVHVFDDADYDATVAQAADAAPYALTGSIIATDRAAIAAATDALRFSAGNFYINDKPTGAVVGQQPFGGARASGTNDKAGSMFNLTRSVKARTVKELVFPPTA